MQRESAEAAHGSAQRPGPKDLAALYRIDEWLASPQPVRLMVVDDVLTTGAHFKAAQDVLTRRFPEVPVFGLFVARRAPEEVDSDALL